MWLLKLAWRNLWRSTRRTAITVCSICFGLVIALVFIGLGDGTYATMINSAARLGSGHITLEHVRYRSTYAARYTLQDVDALAGGFQGIRAIRAWAPRVLGQAMLSTSYGSVGAAFMAVDPAREQNASLFIKKIVRGAYLHDPDGRGALIGSRMAERLRVSLGSKIIITASTLEGDIAQELLRVEGIFETGSDMIDGYLVQLPLSRARTLLGMGPSEATQIGIFLDNQRLTEPIIDRLRQRLASFNDVAVRSWEEVLPQLAAYVRIDSASNYIFQVIIFIIIAAGILNTILMSVMERRHEFGVHLCLGMSPASLFMLVLTETLLLGLLGVSAGTLLGLACNRYFEVKGFDLTLFMREDIDISGVALEPMLYADLYLDHLLITVGLVLLVTVLSGVYPAAKAARAIPVEALHTKA